MQPFETMKFCHPWRPYQARVLSVIKKHLGDKRLHIVAAPGAGKTTLGLEVFRLLGKSALVLSPTRVIRDQWIGRLKDFTATQDVTKLDWVSNSIHRPKVLTSITYQALHTKFSEELSVSEEEDALLEEDEGPKADEVNSFISILQENNIQVLILDEAHHLRAQWWRALEKVCQHFPNMILVSLTATPPYDSPYHEWTRYEQLCGPIDEEISVPELVKAGTLCAHQDYIWACNATESEAAQIKEYDDRVFTLCNTLFNSNEFEEIVLSHPWLKPREIEDDIIKEPKIAIALLSFIKAKSLPANKALMSLLDMKAQDIPELSRHWWQVLLQTILFSATTHHNESQQEFIEQLKKQLRASELLHKKELSIERSKRTERSLSLSASKISACAALHKLEYKHRAETLRQVILTDFIRDEALISGLDTGELNLGAWPVFKHITTTSPIADQVGLLTGRLSIIPSNKLEALLRYLERDKVKVEPMGNEQQYQKVIAPLNQLTSAFTELLMNGDIKVLVGTRSLLGEGWDAPAINSLILASSVGSFMLTNQMRGRAIRINRKDKGKISSIWHIVAIQTKSETGWSDYEKLKERFATFVGLSEKKPTIESGFDRLNATAIGSKHTYSTSAPVMANNREMLPRYKKLDQLAQRWDEALEVGQAARVIPTVTTNRGQGLRKLLLKRSLTYLLIQVAVMCGGVIAGILYAQPKESSEALLCLLIMFIGAFIYKLPKTMQFIKIVFRYLPVDGALRPIGKALAEALCQAGFIETPIKRMRVNVIKKPSGMFSLSLSGGTFYESSVFADCLAEILLPIDNPRYLVLRKGTFLKMAREDYHALPMKFAVKKETAQIFYKCWCNKVGDSKLIYTRTPKGRKRLLKAKMKAFSSVFKDEVKRQDKWQ